MFYWWINHLVGTLTWVSLLYSALEVIFLLSPLGACSSNTDESVEDSRPNISFFVIYLSLQFIIMPNSQFNSTQFSATWSLSFAVLLFKNGIIPIIDVRDHEIFHLQWRWKISWQLAFFILVVAMVNGLPWWGFLDPCARARGNSNSVY